MKVSLDDGNTYINAPKGIRVVYEDIDIPGEDEVGELHINLTNEGIIIDIWVTQYEPLDYNIATRCEMIDDLVAQMIENDS